MGFFRAYLAGALGGIVLVALTGFGPLPETGPDSGEALPEAASAELLKVNLSTPGNRLFRDGAGNELIIDWANSKFRFRSSAGLCTGKLLVKLKVVVNFTTKCSEDARTTIVGTVIDAKSAVVVLKKAKSSAKTFKLSFVGSAIVVTIGPAGGQVELDSLKINFPPGFFDQTMIIKVTKILESFILNNPSLLALTTPYQIEIANSVTALEEPKAEAMPAATPAEQQEVLLDAKLIFTIPADSVRQRAPHTFEEAAHSIKAFFSSTQDPASSSQLGLLNTTNTISGSNIIATAEFTKDKLTELTAKKIGLWAYIDNCERPESNWNVGELFADSEFPATSDKAIIFVHGITGTPARWQYFRDQLKNSDPTYAVYYHFYCTAKKILNEDNQSEMDLGQEFDAAIQAKLPSTVNEIIIIAHSMGGLVTKSAILSAKDRGAAWLPKLKKVVTLGTPHDGSPLASPSEIADDLANVVGLLFGPVASVLARLAALQISDSPGLRDMDPSSEVLSSLSEAQIYDSATFMTAAGTKPGLLGLLDVPDPSDGVVTVASAKGESKSPGLGAKPGTRQPEFAVNHFEYQESDDVWNEIYAWLAETPNPELTLDKTSSTATYDNIGDLINYSYLITNTGNVTLNGPFSVSDDKVAVNCPNISTLAPGANVTCTASYSVTQSDLQAGSVTNTASAQGAFNGQTITSNNDSVTVELSNVGQPASVWINEYTSSSGYNANTTNTRVVAIKQTADGGYIGAGSDYGEGWVIKLDSGGNVLWQKKYGGDREILLSIEATSDNGYIAGIYTDTFGAFQEAHVLKLDGEGNIQWRKNLGSGHTRTVKQMPDGGYVVLAELSGIGGAIIKLDGTGTIQWQKGLTGFVPFSMTLTADPGIATYGMLGNAASVIRMTTDGTVLWQKKYELANAPSGFSSTVPPLQSFQTTSDGGFILGGTIGANYGSEDWAVIRLDAEGNVVWQKKFGGTSNDRLNAIDTAPDGGFLIVGELDLIPKKPWILKLDTNGNIVWQKVYGNDPGTAVAVYAKSDGHIIVATATYGTPWRLSVMKLDSGGGAGQACNLIADTATVSQDTAFVTTTSSITPNNTSITPTDVSLTGTTVTVTKAILCEQVAASSSGVVASNETTKTEWLSEISTAMDHQGVLTISLRGKDISSAILEIFDLGGRRVFTTESSTSRLQFRGQGDRGQRLPNGVYLYIVTMRGPNQQIVKTEVKKLLILR